MMYFLTGRNKPSPGHPQILQRRAHGPQGPPLPEHVQQHLRPGVREALPVRRSGPASAGLQPGGDSGSNRPGRASHLLPVGAACALHHETAGRREGNSLRQQSSRVFQVILR